MFDALVLVGYILLIYVLVDKDSRYKLLYWCEIILLDKLVMIKVVSGLFVLFMFVSVFVSNIWNLIGLFLLFILLPIILFTKEQLED